MRKMSLSSLWIGMTLVLLLVGAGHAQGTQVLVVPPSSVVAPGGAVTVEIQIRDVVDLYGVDLHLAFDPTQLEAQDADGNSANGVQIASGEFLDITQGFLGMNAVNNTTGQVRYVFALMSPAPAASGSGVLARITFRASSPGSSTLDFVNVLLANERAESIPVTVSGGLIVVSTGTITPPPTAPATGTYTPTTMPSPTRTAIATTTSTATGMPSPTRTSTRTPTGITSPTRTATSTATVAPSPTSTPIEEVILKEAARTLGWPEVVVRQPPLYKVQYVAAAGHSAEAWMQGYERTEDAHVALVRQRDGLIADGWDVQGRLFHNFEAYQATRSLNPGSPTLPMNERTFVFQGFVWVGGAYAFDDTYYQIAPDPETVAEAVYQAGRRNGLFFDWIPRLWLPLVLRSYPPPAPSPTPMASVTPLPTSQFRQWILNPSFETDEAWEILPTAYPAGYSPVRAHTGARSMRLGIDTGYNVYSFSSVQQTVTLPAGTTQAELSFYYFPVSPQADGDRIYFSVLRASDDGLLQNTYWADANQVWNWRTFDLLAYAGQRIKLRFGVRNDGLDGVMVVYLDDVELRVVGNE